ARLIFNLFFFFLVRCPPPLTLFPYTTLFRSPIPSAKSFVFRLAVIAAMRLSPLFARSPRHYVTLHFSTPRTDQLPRAACRKMERSEEHTSELQSRGQLAYRLLLEKRKTSLPT